MRSPRKLNLSYGRYLSWLGLICLSFFPACTSAPSPEYIKEAEACLAQLRMVDEQRRSGRTQNEVAPHLVTARVAIENFLERYDQQGLERFNQELKAALDAYLDGFILDDTISTSRPIRRGSVLEQQLTSRYPEIVTRLGPVGEHLDARAALPIVQAAAEKHLQQAIVVLNAGRQSP